MNLDPDRADPTSARPLSQHAEAKTSRAGADAVVRNVRKLVREGRHAEAHEALARAESEGSAPTDRRGRSMFAMERYQVLLAEERFDDAAAYAQQNGLGAGQWDQIALARAHEGAGRTEEARIVWKRVLKGSRNHLAALKALGLLHMLDAEAPLIGAICADVTASLGGQVFCVQVGANDGAVRDPAQQGFTELGWRGIRVEPMPSAFKGLQAACEGLSVVPVNAAIGAADGTMPFYTPRSGNTRISSFAKEHIERVEGKGAPVDVIDVEVKTLRTLLAEHAVERLDVLWVDAEGFDAVVVRSLDLERYRPSLIVYEHHNMPGQVTALEAYLTEAGYECFRLSTDTFCLPAGSAAGHYIRAYAGLLRAYRKAVQAVAS